MATKLTVSITINAPLEKVWDAMWNPTHIIHWCFASDDWHCPKALGEEPKVGGVFTNTFAAKDGSFSFDFTAKYDVVEPMKYIKYTMGEMKEYFLDAGRVVDVNFEVIPLSERGMSEGQGDFVPLDKVNLAENEREGTLEYKGGSEAGGFIKITETFDAEDIHDTEMQRAGWQAILENFKKYVESI